MKISIDFYSLLLFSLFFDAYSFYQLNNYSVTSFTIISFLFIFYRLLKSNLRRFAFTLQRGLLILLICWLFINFVYFDFCNAGSFLLALYFLVFALVSYREVSEIKFDYYCSLFQKLMTICSIYGIYQLFGRIYNLPFSDLYFNGYMVEGYNWTNKVVFMGESFYRSNAIFREPSFFSQMLAISLLLYLPNIISNKFKKQLFPIFLQNIALLTTFSGTGVIMIIVGVLIFLIHEYKFRIIKNKVFIIGLLFLTLFLFSSIGEYYLYRFNELFEYKVNSSSGFVRFRAWIYIVEEAWSSNFFIGDGIGSGKEYICKYSGLFYAMTLHGVARVATELGAFGIVIWSSFILSFFYNRNVYSSYNYLILVCSIVPFVFMHESFSSCLFWFFASLLNCRISSHSRNACSV